MVPMVTTIEGRPNAVTRKPLKAPQSGTDAEADADQRAGTGAGLRREAHGERDERDDRGDRQVDLAHEDQQRHAERDRSPSRRN